MAVAVGFGVEASGYFVLRFWGEALLAFYDDDLILVELGPDEREIGIWMKLGLRWEFGVSSSYL